jgi:hypothetical protein
MACSKGSAKTRLNQLGTIMVSPLHSKGFQYMDCLVPSLPLRKLSGLCELENLYYRPGLTT